MKVREGSSMVKDFLGVTSCPSWSELKETCTLSEHGGDHSKSRSKRPAITSNGVPMRYLPKSPADREAMLKAIGKRSIDDLFAPIPAEYRLNRDLKVPRQMAESEIVEWFRERSHENGDGYTTFLGAGRY